MINFALCFLAYGNEHINEFNNLNIFNLNLPIFVLTNDKSKIDNISVNVIETHQEFNFNLKRHVVAEAFKQYDTIILMDTDVNITSFSFLSEVNTDRVWVKWIAPKLTHKGNRLNIHNNEYCVELSKLNKHNLPIQFIPEFCVIIKIEDIDKRFKFIERWDEIHNLIKQFEPTDRHYNLNGAIEGCIIYLTCMDLGIPIIPFGNKLEITHYASTNFVKHLV